MAILNPRKTPSKYNITSRRVELSNFRNASKIRKCFHPDNSECNGSIIKAHSLQKNGVLNLLQEEVDGNNVVYSFEFPLYSAGKIIGFKPLGKAKASTFTGFCKFHDKNLFAEIEDNEIDFENPKHIFLLSYRSFAKEFHAKMEYGKGIRSSEGKSFIQNDEIRTMLDYENTIGLRDGDLVRNELNRILINEEYEDIDYIVYDMPYCVPIACASCFTPSVSYKGTKLNAHKHPDIPYEIIIITVIPTLTGTYAVLACLKNQSKSVKYLDDLEKLPPLKMEKAISSILIREVSNTFISPLIWTRLKRKQELLISDLLNTRHDIIDEKFFQTKINFFDEQFSISVK